MTKYLNSFLLSIALTLSHLDQANPMNLLFPHVATATLAIILYTILTCNSFIILLLKSPLLIQTNKILLKIGLLPTLLALITGSLWGKLTWGTYWQWDSKLTSFLILSLFYFLALHFYTQNEKTGTLIILLGAINIPLIKFSVNWGTTLHQPNTELLHTTYQYTLLIWILMISTFLFQYYQILKKIRYRKPFAY